VRVSHGAAGAEVTWDAAAGLAALVPAYRVYRGGALVGTVAAPGHGYGDEPVPARWRPRYMDSGFAAQAGSAVPAYHIVAVGRNGTESARVRAQKESVRPPAGARPDLVVERIEWSPADATPGATVGVRATIRNRGAAPTPPGVPVTVGFRIDGGERIGASSFVPLARGAEVTLAARTVPTEQVWKAVLGEHTVTAEADELDRITEADEDNTLSRKQNELATALPK